MVYAVFSYFFMIIMLVIAYFFPYDKVLVKNMTKKDYIAILEYLSDIPVETDKQEYFDGLVMIKRTLNEAVYYNMGTMDETYRDNICYLQGQFVPKDKSKIIPSILFNKSYIEALSKQLLIQINGNNIELLEMETLIDKYDNVGKKGIQISSEIIKVFCTSILVIIVIYKVVVTVNRCEILNNVFEEIVYNTSADIIALILAVESCWKRE